MQTGFLKVFALKNAHKKRSDSSNMEEKARKRKIASLHFTEVVFFCFVLFSSSI